MKDIIVYKKTGFWAGIKVLITFIFLVFIFFVLSLGRAFALLHVGPIYITEIVLSLSLFLFFCEKKAILQIPPVLGISVLIYFILSCSYLLIGLLKNNFFTLRDVVLSGYVIFFPMSVIIFSEKNKLKLFFYTLFFGNCLGFILGRLLLYRTFELPSWLYFITQIKGFNFALYYGISISFLASFFNFTKQKIYKFLIMMLLALNTYVIMVWGIRTAWISYIILALFLLTVLSNKEKIESIIYFIPVFIIAVAINFTYFSDLLGIKRGITFGKLPSVGLFLKTVLSKNNEPSPAKTDIKQNHSKRNNNNNIGKEEKLILTDKFYSPKEPSPKQQVAIINVLSSNLPQEYKNSYANIQWRFDVWNIALSSGLEYPVLGRGFGEYPIRYPMPTTIRANSGVKPVHNHILSIFYKMGILGLGLFLFINVYAFLYGLVYLRKCNTGFCKYFLIGSLGSLVFWHVMAFFFDVIESPPTSIFLWIILGLIFACIHVDKNSLNTVTNK